MSSKKKLLIFLILSIFISISVWIKNPELKTGIYKKLGTELFLNYHINSSALYFLEKASGVRPDDYETYYLLGRVNFIENKLPDSIFNYTKSIQLSPKFKEAYYGRGLAYGFSGPIFLLSAQEDFQKYIDLDNEEFKQTGRHAYGAWAGYNDLAWIYFLQGDFTNAEKTAREGLLISNYNPWLSNMLGAVLLEKGNCKEAKEYLQNAANEAESITAKQFGEAYSGDDDMYYAPGLENMRETIKENLKKCEVSPT